MKIFFFSFLFCSVPFFTIANNKVIVPLLISDYLQEDSLKHPPPYISIIPTFELGLPLSDFNKKMESAIPVGKGIGIFYRFENQPLSVGLRFVGLTYAKFKDIYTDSLGVEIKEKTKTKIWLWHASALIEPKVNWPVQPYFEMGLGVQRFFTRTKGRETGLNIQLFDDDWFPEDLYRDVHLSDWGLNFIGAAGLKINLSDDFSNSLDIQAGYLYGQAASFYVKTSDPSTIEDPLDPFEQKRAPLSMFSMKIGINLMVF